MNYDPSNTILAGEDPLELLRRVKHRVVTMHASDRYLAEGTIEDLRREEDVVGYAKRLRHGEIGKGMNDYDAIFTELAGVGFDGWISIEDGVDGIDQLGAACRFCETKLPSIGQGSDRPVLLVCRERPLCRPLGKLAWLLRLASRERHGGAPFGG